MLLMVPHQAMCSTALTGLSSQCGWISPVTRKPLRDCSWSSLKSACWRPKNCPSWETKRTWRER